MPETAEAIPAVEPSVLDILLYGINKLFLFFKSFQLLQPKTS